MTSPQLHGSGLLHEPVVSSSLGAVFTGPNQLIADQGTIWPTIVRPTHNRQILSVRFPKPARLVRVPKRLAVTASRAFHVKRAHSTPAPGRLDLMPDRLAPSFSHEVPISTAV